MNTPNKITLLRILMIPLVVFFYLATFIPWNFFISGIIFIVASLTDFLDGYLARKNNQVTDLGKFLDAIADKMLVASALILIVAFPVVQSSSNVVISIVKPQWLGICFAVLILCREFAISALRMVAASKGKVLAADKSGKIKTAVTLVTLTLYFFYAFYTTKFYDASSLAHKNANAAVAVCLIVLFGISALLTVYSGVQYFLRNGHIFSQTPKTAEIECQNAIVKKVIPKSEEKAQKDQLLIDAMQIFLQNGEGSASMLQRHLGIGYPRASKVLQQLEELGFLSKSDGTKARRVLISKEDFEKWKKG